MDITTRPFSAYAEDERRVAADRDAVVSEVERGPDLLAAFHLAGIDVAGKLGVVALLGTHIIPEGELHHFKEKRVRFRCVTSSHLGCRQMRHG